MHQWSYTRRNAENNTAIFSIKKAPISGPFNFLISISIASQIVLSHHLNSKGDIHQRPMNLCQ